MVNEGGEGLAEIGRTLFFQACSLWALAEMEGYISGALRAPSDLCGWLLNWSLSGHFLLGNGIMQHGLALQQHAG